MTAATIDRREKPTQDTLPVLLGLKEIHALFPGVARTTIYRWNTVRSGHKQLPDPVRVVSETPLWTLEQVQAFAREKDLKLDAAALRRIRAEQG